MPTFRYANPPVIHWGEGALRELPAELDRAGARRVLLVTTGSALSDDRLAPAVERAMAGRVAGRCTVPQHAPASSVMAASEAARAAGADALVSLGGGSPIDAAKAVAFVLASGLDLRERDAPARARDVKLGTTLPHVALPTTLSAAELSSSAGFSAEGTREKVGVGGPALGAAAVVYDAALAVRTPLPLWLSTGIRAVDHAVETLLAPGEHPLADAAALAGLRRLKEGLEASHARPDDPAARTACQLGAWHSYLLPGPAARGLSHTLGKRLGSRHGIPHGVTSCLLLPHVLRHLQPRAPGPMARIAAALGSEDAAGGVAALIASLGLPRHLAAWRLGEAELRAAARPGPGAELPEEVLLAILRAAL
ncbi:MAG TPA: iron-containing alcohol dehydrogenase [Anaeromyxobacteraceae bacterium]|nr:iron-containing alcohol dehydrogenase [Anaeromyxobacteraceae bacterium]